jgi:D-tyrosyl-tRNA(Tyr) deacylase
LLGLVAVEPGDGEPQARRMCERLLGYRVFGDDEGRMNLSLTDSGGGLLLVPQFTLAADTRSGLRPSFTTAASPDAGRRWFDRLVELARAAHPGVATGRFGAHMQVRLVNDGPVSFILRV